jgi:hypothetical protein
VPDLGFRGLESFHLQFSLLIINLFTVQKGCLKEFLFSGSTKRSNDKIGKRRAKRIRMGLYNPFIS